MRDINEVIRAKQQQYEQLSREIEILQQAIPLLRDDQPNAQTAPDVAKRWP
jgi:hypothetical protein